MFFNDARRDREAQAGAGLFGGKKWVEEACHELRGDSHAVVAYFHDGAAA